MQAIINWILSHEVILGAGGVAIMDFVFAIMPSWQSNGILHWVFLQLQKIAGSNSSNPPSPPAAA